MDGRRAGFAFVALAVAAAAVALMLMALAPRGPATTLLVLPWALAVGGPAAVWLLHAPAAASGRAWLRLVAPLLVGAAGALAFFEASLLFRHPARDAASWVIPLGLPLAFLAAAVPAWRRSDATARGWMAAALAAFGVLFAAGVALAGLGFFALEAALFLGVAGFRRSLRAWATAAFAGLLVLLVGMTFVLALRGSLWPPRVILDAQEFATLVLPMALAGAATACGTLLFWRERRPIAA